MPGRGTSGDDHHEFDGLVLDEDFIRGGVHEPPARTRAAIARYGNSQSSWRQSPPLAPAPTRARRQRRASEKLPLLILVTVAALAIGGLAAWNALHAAPIVSLPAATPSVSAAMVPALAAGGAPVIPQPVATTDVHSVVRGLHRSDAPGTCYSSQDLAHAVEAEMERVQCSRPHGFELVSHRFATGSDSAYPTKNYWSGPVMDACSSDQEQYMAKAREQWPPGVTGMLFTPIPASWANGDRDVFCMAVADPAAVGRVKG